MVFYVIIESNLNKNNHSIGVKFEREKDYLEFLKEYENEGGYKRFTHEPYSQNQQDDDILWIPIKLSDRYFDLILKLIEIKENWKTQFTVFDTPNIIEIFYDKNDERFYWTKYFFYNNLSSTPERQIKYNSDDIEEVVNCLWNEK